MAGVPRPKRNLAAAAGAWSARHRWKAVGIWLAFVVIAMVVGQAFGTAQLKDSEGAPGDAGRGQGVIATAGFGDHASESVLVQGTTLTASQPPFRSAVNATIAALQSTGKVQNVRSPLAPGSDAVSKDGHSALIQFDVVGDQAAADSKITPILDAVERVQHAHPAVRIEEFGDASANKALTAALDGDLKRAELLSLPITFAILFFAFGALVAALLPVGLAFTAFLAAAGLLGPVSRIFHTNQTASTVMLLVGMAVGVDYSLFYLRREREERRAGRSPEDALAVAAATSGRSVLVSGLTVVVAMAGMFLAGNAVFSAVAQATILVVLVAVIGSVTVLPALLALLGDRVDRGRSPSSASDRGVSGAAVGSGIPPCAACCASPPAPPGSRRSSLSRWPFRPSGCAQRAPEPMTFRPSCRSCRRTRVSSRRFREKPAPRASSCRRRTSPRRT